MIAEGAKCPKDDDKSGWDRGAGARVVWALTACLPREGWLGVLNDIMTLFKPRQQGEGVKYE
jgi:hypothetical protein